MPRVRSLKSFAENQLPACVTCHNHHDIMRTSDAMIGVTPAATCVSCHDEGSGVRPGCGHAAGSGPAPRPPQSQRPDLLAKRGLSKQEQEFLAAHPPGTAQNKAAR